jgi:Rrf2 family iron-sulfur cluster assembly transcriptional regulator
MLTTKGRYAVMALVEMANMNRFIEGGKAIALQEISENVGITQAYLEQIFSKLKAANIVKSQRGPGGGYIFVKPVSELRISEVIAAAEEEIKITGCGGEAEKPCISGAKGKCATHDLWEGLGGAINNYLSGVTLEDVVNRKIETRN